MSFEIKEIKIKLYTNLPAKDQKLIDFDLDLLYSETRSAPNEKGETKAELLDKTGLNKLPYFTMSVKYPLARLQKDLLTYQDRVRFFFDEKEFQKKLFLFTQGPTESDDVDVNNDIAEHNVMTMIEILFPTKFTVINNFHTSLDHVFSKSYLGRMMINPTVKKYYSYLKLNDGKIYTFTRVIWLNDIMNHPLYRTLLTEFHTFWLWYAKEKNKLIKSMSSSLIQISKNIDSILLNIFRGIKQSFIYYDNIPDYNEVEFGITHDTLDIVSKIMRFKTVVDRLKETNIISVDDLLKQARFNKNNEKDKDYLKTIHEETDATIKELQKRELAESKLINFDIDEEDADSDYKKISEYIGEYFTLSEINKKELIITHFIESTKDANIPIPSSAKQYLEKIKTSIKTLYLNPLKTPLSKFKSLQLYITKPIDDVEANNKTLNTEYATFMRNVRSRYWGAQRKTVNTYLQNLIDCADEQNVTDFFKTFSTIYSMYMLGKKTRMFMELEEKIRNVVNAGITKINTNVQNWQYEIYIMADFIQGKVDDENADKIFCPYVGEYLGTLFEFLFTLSLYGKGNEDDKMRWAVDRNRVFFSLDQIKLKNGDVRQELTQKPLNVSLLAQKGDSNSMAKFGQEPILNAGAEEAMPHDEDRINSLFVQNVISADKDITGENGILTKLKQYVPDIDESRILSYVSKNNKDLYKIIKKWHDNEFTRSQTLLEEMLKLRPVYQGDNAATQQKLNDPNYILDSTEKIKLRTKAEFNNLYLSILDKLIELEKAKAIDTNVANLRATSGGTRRIVKKKKNKTRRRRNRYF